MPNLGFSELIVILMILLLVFGASRLPALGESLGRTIRGFKRGLASDENIAIKPADGPREVTAGDKRENEIAEADIVERKPKS